MPSSRHTVYLTVLISIPLLLFAGNAWSQKATPSHAFQVVDTLNAELALLLEANESQAGTDPSAPALTPRRPRHVLQNARLVNGKLQALRGLNGLPYKPLGQLPATEVSPADVQALATQLLADARELRPIFGITEPPVEIAFVDGKKPLDVYQQFINASLKLDGLEIPAIVPNDVYRVALEIHRSLNALVDAQGGFINSVDLESRGKKPDAVYSAAHELLKALKAKAEENGWEIPGGIVLPNRREGAITPTHVLSLVNTIYGDIHSLTVVLGVTKADDAVPPQSGRTPSNVYDAVQASLILVDQLK